MCPDQPAVEDTVYNEPVGPPEKRSPPYGAFCYAHKTLYQNGLLRNIAGIMLTTDRRPGKIERYGREKGMDERIDLGRWTAESLDRMLKDASRRDDAGERIEYLSRQFLGVPYGEGTLTGGKDIDEIFVIELGTVDCFTFLDYIESMRTSSSFIDFRKTLASVRYRGGEVRYESRNHFFTDWIDRNESRITDVTEDIGGDKTQRMEKWLNKKENGSLFLSAIPVVPRTISYVPVPELAADHVAKLKQGDYLGIYSPVAGLDVSHVGIVVRRAGESFLRHASSPERQGRVVDEKLLRYLHGKAGIVVLRPVV